MGNGVAHKGKTRFKVRNCIVNSEHRANISSVSYLSAYMNHILVYMTFEGPPEVKRLNHA